MPQIQFFVFYFRTSLFLQINNHVYKTEFSIKFNFVACQKKQNNMPLETLHTSQ